MGWTTELEKYEIEVLPFTNEQVLCQFDYVKKEILSVCIRKKELLEVHRRGFRGINSLTNHS